MTCGSDNDNEIFSFSLRQSESKKHWAQVVLGLMIMEVATFIHIRLCQNDTLYIKYLRRVTAVAFRL